MITKACASGRDPGERSASPNGLIWILSLGRFGAGPGSAIQDSLPGAPLGFRALLVMLWLQGGGFLTRLLRAHGSEGGKNQRACS